MEVISSWSAETVSAYLQGLEASVQRYPFQEWGIGGRELLDLSPQYLEALGVRSIGHQEVILEAVEQLCALHYDLHRESLHFLTDKLYRATQVLHSHLTTLRRAPVSQSSAISPSHKQLTCIIDIVSAARVLFSWLNRYLFTRLNDYSASRDVIALCAELAEMLHKDWTESKVEARILTICENICGICISILNYSPESLLSQTATLELVQLYPQPSCSLGLEVKSTSSGQHFVYQTAPESPARQCETIHPGDEIIKVNEQVVVGWTHKNLIRKLQEKSNCVSLILKKVSLPASKSPASQSKSNTRESFNSRSTDRSPSHTLARIIFATTEDKTPKEHVLALKTSIPNLVPTHRHLVATQSIPASLPDKLLRSKIFIRKTSSSSESYSESNKDSPSESKSPGHNTWPHSEPSPHFKPHASSIFPSLHISSTSPVLPAQPEMISSNIFAKTLTPVIQSSPDAEQQGVKQFQKQPDVQSGLETVKPIDDEEITRILMDLAVEATAQPSQAAPREGEGSGAQTDLAHRLDNLERQLSLVVPKKAANKKRHLVPAYDEEDLFASFGSEEEQEIDVPLSEAELRSASSSSVQKTLGFQSPNIKKKLNVSETDSSPTSDKESVQYKHAFCVSTKLSRRRVSCKDLGSPDCDGWLMQKKENVSFMSQRWKRYWCILKKDKLYWYNGPQDEKALGLVNVSAYNLESPWEAKHKKKYEFQLSHPTHKPFLFAAENLTEMKKWVTCLVKTLQKYKVQPNANHSKEDCYSETEAEDDDQPKAQDVVKNSVVAMKSPVSPREKGVIRAEDCSNTQSQDDLHLMMTCLKQGGVSLIGKKTTMTRDEYRRSFAKRNKNPAINQKAHTLRVLQSTLKAKIQELEALNQVLDHPNLNSSTFQKWKSEHEQLYGTVGSAAAEEYAYSMDIDKNAAESSKGSDESEASD
ncbi:connector enhancer of kinase suppressor of ras 1 [Gastrophryne carolinensis]